MKSRIHSCFFIAILLSCTISIHAQEKEEVKPLKRFLVSMSLGAVPLPGQAESFLPGLEFYITERFSAFSEISLPLNKQDVDSSAVNKKYFRFKIEGRYYVLPDIHKVKPYAAIQFTTASRSLDVNRASRYYEIFQKDSAYNFSRASINSPVQTLTAQLGLAIKIFRELYVDIALGGGVRFIQTTYSDVVGLQKVKNPNFLFIAPLSSYRYIGNQTRSQLNLNFRLSYRF